MSEKTSKSWIIEYISYSLAAISVVIGMATIVGGVDCKADLHTKALLWFGFGLLAVLVPYVKEITFKDLKLVIDQIDRASQRLEGVSITAEELNNRLGATKDELVNGYQELLRLLPEDKRKQRVVNLSKLYMQEMQLEVLTVKKWLVEIGRPVKKIDNEIDDDYLSTLSELQKANGLGDDGIFGYRTLNLIMNLRRAHKKE